MIVIDYQNRKPIYEQIVERFQMLIIKGILKADSQMPSVRSLAGELSINPNTIQRAYTELERQGFIYSVKGKGSFVADSGRLRRERLREWEREFDRLAEEGFQIGLSAEDLTGRIRSLEEKREEGGINHD